MSDDGRCLDGRPIPGWALPAGHASAQLHVDPVGVTLLLHADEPTRVEQDAVCTGPVQVGLLRPGMHTLFLLYNIGALTAGWADVAWTPPLLPPEQRAGILRPCPSWTLTIGLVDLGRRRLVARREGSPGAAFRTAFGLAIGDLWRALPHRDAQTCRDEIEATNRRYRTTEAMLRAGVVLDDGGTVETLG